MQLLFRTIRYALNFFNELYKRRNLIWQLGVRELRKNYIGSVLGISWLFLEHLIFVTVLWIVFTQGFKFRAVSQLPFLPWFISSYMLWIFISACLTSSSNLFRNFDFLLKRWKFNISILPVVNIVQFILIHFVFLVILICVCLLYRLPVTWYWFQSVYYMLSTIFLILGLTWLIASISLFIQDIKNIVAIVIQIGFWVSPIYWDTNNFPGNYQFFIKINPIHYLLQGYRDCFLYAVPFWHKIGEGLYFWSITIVFLLLGLFTYKKLRPHFGDVL